MKTLTLIKQSFSTRHLKKVSLRKYFDNVFTAEVPCFTHFLLPSQELH